MCGRGRTGEEGMADPSESIPTPSLSDLSGKVQLGDSETKTCFQSSSSWSEVQKFPFWTGFKAMKAQTLTH